MTYWPFWLGSIALATVAFGYVLLLRRPFGVSGMVARVLDADVLRAERAATAPPSPEALDAAIAAATARAFGISAVEAHMQPVQPVDAAAGAESVRAPAAQLSWSVYALFLAGIVGGGAVSAFLSSSKPTFDPGAAFASLFGHGATALACLFVGGTFVGLGTRLAAGCTSGHGLTGCARLQPGSLVATAAFFGIGIALSCALAWVRL